MKNFFTFFIALFLVASCAKKSGFKDSDPTLFKEYISGFSSGSISADAPIEVVLTQLDSKALEGVEVDKLFDFSPKVEGKTTINGNFLKFTPENPLEHNKEYQVTFHVDKLFKVKKDLANFYFHIRTKSLQFEVNVRDLQSYNQNYYFLNASIEASDNLSPEIVSDIVKANINGKSLSVRALTNEKNTEIPIIIDSIPTPTDQSQTLTIEWNGSQYDIESSGSSSLNIPTNNNFGVVQLLQNEGENNSFNIVFSAPLQKNQEFRGLIAAENYDGDFRFSTSGNTLKVYADSNFENEVKISVFQGIKSQYGERMKYDFSGKLAFDPIKPQVRLVRNGTILPSSQNLKVNFQTINLKAVEISVLKIYQNNVLQFLQENDFGGAYNLRRVGATIAQKVVPIKATTKNSLSKWSTHAIDLSKIITPEPGAIYRVKIDFKKEYALNCNNDKTPIKEENLLVLEEDGNSDYYDYDDYDYDYDWEERDDPCKDSYYYGKSVETNILATDLGVVVKRGQNNDYTVVVNNILTTEPVNGAKIALFDYQQQKLTEATTNNEGKALMTTQKRAYFAVAYKDNNTTYVKIEDGASQSVSNYEVGGLELEKGRSGYIYTERGVWRPGDTISVGFIFNDFANKLPESLPIKLTFSDPNGKVVQQLVKNSTTENHYLFTLHTQPEAITGNWSCQIKVGASTYSKTIKIETIKPNRLKINNSLSEKFISNEGQNASLQVDWLQGTPASNVKVEITGKLYPKVNPFKGYESYTFNNTSFPSSSEEITIFEGQTNERGSASFFFQPKKLENATQMLRINFLTKANEQGGDFSTDVTSATYSPFATYVGIKAPNDNYYYETGKATKFQTVILSEEGKPVAGHRVKLYAYKIEKNWWWDISEYNISSYNSSDSKSPAFTTEATTGQDGKATFNIQIKNGESGRYFLLVEDSQSKHEAGIDARFYSWGESGENTGTEATMLMLTTNKKDYKVGEKAIVTFPSDANGRALISVENGSKVLRTYWVNTQKGKTTYEVPVSEDMAPNVYLYVTLLQPHAQTKNDAPIRLYGIAPISVYNPKTKIEPIIEMPEVLRPEKQVTIKVREKSGKPMTYSLAIVEDGLLDLTRFKTPNPWNTFFAKAALGVKTWDIYNDVIGAFGGTINQIFSIGGDEDLGGGNTKKANRFKALSIVEGPFTLSGGTKTHQIKLPNYIGSARVMVVASDVKNNAFGSAEKTATIKSPVMVLASLPRKAVPGETITLPVTVFANEKQVKNVSVSVKTNDKFSLSSSTQQVSFDQPGEKMVYFTLKVKEIGIGKITVEALSGGEKSTYSVDMDVLNPNPKIYQVKNVILQPNTSQSIAFEVFGEKGTNTSTLELSSFPGVNLSQRLKYLIEYPHGCGEQVTSGAFPQLYLSDFENLSSKQQQEVQQNVSAAIRKLSQHQLSNGGFSYWQGSDYADEWVTSYIGQFYIEAEKKGFSLPMGSKSKWLNYQKTMARNWTYNGSHSTFNQAYRLYTLALAKSPDMASMNRLRETSSISNEALSRLAAAYAIAGQKNVAASLFSKVTFDSGSEDSYYGYGSPIRNNAMSLETALYLGKSQIAAELALKISEKLSSSEWLSTQTTAYGLYAMALYVSKNKTGKSWTATYQEGKDSGSLTSSSTGYASKTLSSQIGNHKVSVQNKSAVTLYARVVSSGILPVGKELVQENGLSVSTHYSNKNGSLSVESLPQGTSFTCEISVKNTTQSAVSNIALTQFVPSGWEIVNTRFTDYDTDSSKWDYADIRDDRAHIYFGLKAGETKKFTLQLNASYKGTYYLPGSFAEAMYDAKYNTHNKGSWIKVE